MDRNEAIKWLEAAGKYFGLLPCEFWQDNKISEALDLATEALREKHQLSEETSTISEKESVDGDFASLHNKSLWRMGLHDSNVRPRTMADTSTNEGDAESATTTDCISRQAAIDAVEKAVFKGVAKSAIESLPAVEPKRLLQPHKCVVYRDGECRYPIEACSECPKHEGMRAVLAERPKGEWKCMADCGVTECDQCGWNVEEYVGDYNFCPNCGADCRGENDEK